MQFIWWLAISALYSLWPDPVAIASNCSSPRPGQCIGNNSNDFDDRKVLSLDSLSCPFCNSLCSYKQGCQDENMLSWSVGYGFAQARQNASKGSCPAFSYSVLESPWINFTIPVCFHFTFSRYTPQALAVFLANRTSSVSVTTLLQEDNNTFYAGENQTESFTIPPLVGKISFRIKGGAPGLEGPFLKLYLVPFEKGRCETPACSFDDSGDPLCGWTAVKWGITSGNDFAMVTTQGGVATLTSPLTRATGENPRDCLKFGFKLKHAGDSLTVTVDTDGDSFLIWSLDASTDNNGGWRNATVQIVTIKAYQIVLRGQKHRDSGGVKVRDIQVTTQESSESCETQPPGAVVNVTLPLRSTTPGLRGSTTPDPAGSGASRSSDDGAVIGGTIAALLIVIIIVVVIVGFFFYRRRQARKSENRNMGTALPVHQNGANRQGEKDASKGYAQIQDLPISHPQHIQGYSVLNHVSPTSDVTRSGDDVSPYELEDDGTVRQPNAVSKGDFSQVGKAQKLPVNDHPAATADGDYSCISEATNSPRPERCSAGDDSYSYIGHSQIPPQHEIRDASDNYHYIEDSQISPKFGSGDDDYNHIGDSTSSAQDKITGVSDDYSHVSGSKPSPGRKGNGVNDDYNHIDSSQHLFPSENSSHNGQKSRKPVPGSGLNYELARVEADDESDSNNGYSFARDQTSHLAAASPPQTGEYSKVKRENRAARETTSTQKKKSAPGNAPNNGDSGDYSLQKPVAEEVEDYNTLCFEEERKKFATDATHGVTRKPYDHVQSNPDDDYSKTQIGKRNVVIDSDYDHLKP